MGVYDFTSFKVDNPIIETEKVEAVVAVTDKEEPLIREVEESK